MMCVKRHIQVYNKKKHDGASYIYMPYNNGTGDIFTSEIYREKILHVL